MSTQLAWIQAGIQQALEFVSADTKVRIDVMDRLRAFARCKPGLFSGIWFSAPLLLLAIPAGIGTLGYLVEAQPSFVLRYSVLTQMIPEVLAPLICIFGIGALLGRRILALERNQEPRAAGIGAMTVLVAMLIHLSLVEGVPFLLGEGSLKGCIGGDIPGAALVVAYVIGIPVTIMVGTVAGVLLGISMHRISYPLNKYLD